MRPAPAGLPLALLAALLVCGSHGARAVQGEDPDAAGRPIWPGKQQGGVAPSPGCADLTHSRTSLKAYICP